jgi:hypothetical protein
MNVSLWGFVRFFAGVNLIVVSVAYFATGWTVFGNIPVNQAIVHVILAILGIRLAIRAALQAMRRRDASRSESEQEQDGNQEYGYNDQWERENL